jgi:hypothetical protein
MQTGGFAADNVVRIDFGAEVNKNPLVLLHDDLTGQSSCLGMDSPLRREVEPQQGPALDEAGEHLPCG